MPKGKEKKKKSEQLPLIDVQPKNKKEIIACANRYKKAQSERIEALNREKEEKQSLLDLVEKGNLQRLDDGTIKFHVDGMTITVTPRDELVQVKEDQGE